MGMFDYYQPTEKIKCPKCGYQLKEWQGKGGHCALLVWQQNNKQAVDQKVDKEVKLTAKQRDNFLLPNTFEIYSYDCPDHQPICATGICINGIWSKTKLHV
ncbi:MAG: hypothetical protein ACRBCK_11605 [Alphaproteobacteria bacterium]